MRRKSTKNTLVKFWLSDKHCSTSWLNLLPTTTWGRLRMWTLESHCLLQIPALHFLAVWSGTATLECLGLRSGKWDEGLPALLKGFLWGSTGKLWWTECQPSTFRTCSWIRAALIPAALAAILFSPLRLKVREALHAVHNDHCFHVTLLFLLPVTTVFQSLSSNLSISSHQNARSSRDLDWFRMGLTTYSACHIPTEIAICSVTKRAR